MAYFNNKSVYDISEPIERSHYYRGKIIASIINVETLIEMSIGQLLEGKDYGRIFKIMYMYEGITLKTKSNIFLDLLHMEHIHILNQYPDYKKMMEKIIDARNKAAHLKLDFNYVDDRKLLLRFQAPVIKKEKRKDNTYSAKESMRSLDLDDELFELLLEEIEKVSTITSDILNQNNQEEERKVNLSSGPFRL